MARRLQRGEYPVAGGQRRSQRANRVAEMNMLEKSTV